MWEGCDTHVHMLSESHIYIQDIFKRFSALRILHTGKVFSYCINIYYSTVEIWTTVPCDVFCDVGWRTCVSSVLGSSPFRVY